MFLDTHNGIDKEICMHVVCTMSMSSDIQDIPPFLNSKVLFVHYFLFFVMRVCVNGTTKTVVVTLPCYIRFRGSVNQVRPK